jgi:FAD:protein FMN transferase
MRCLIPRQLPEVRGFLLDIGGDMVAWGESSTGPGWPIGIANPTASAENAPPLARLRLSNAAVATSGPYQRFTTIGNKQYSHIFDPRTGQPAEGIASSTVIAPDSVTANALATALCVLTPEEGLRLIEKLPGVECLVIATDGRQWRSRGFTTVQDPPPAAPQAAKVKPWPKDFQVQVTLTLANLTNAKGYRRPYVAVWLENDQAKPVRTLAVWGNAPKYQRDLTYWWKFAQNDKNLILAVTRATRPPGQYQLLWDGTDEKRIPLGQGTYKVIIEVHREHGKHIRQMGDIICGGEKTSVALAKTAETDEAKVTYGPKEK